MGRAPSGARGLKHAVVDLRMAGLLRRAPSGARGLKHVRDLRRLYAA